MRDVAEVLLLVSAIAAVANGGGGTPHEEDGKRKTVNGSCFAQLRIKKLTHRGHDNSSEEVTTLIDATGETSRAPQTSTTWYDRGGGASWKMLLLFAPVLLTVFVGLALNSLLNLAPKGPTLGPQSLQAPPKAAARGAADGHDDAGVALNNPSGEKSFFRPDIEGLRAFAVLAVVIFHMENSWLPGGFVGVDVFYVISGFVVAGSLQRSPKGTVWEYLVDFYSRRIKRLWPALIAVVSATGLCMALWIPPWMPELEQYYLTGFSSLLGVSNNFFIQAKGGGYFDQEIATEQNPFLHTWSLGVEEQFYLVFPVMLLLSHGRLVVRAAALRHSLLGPTVVFGASIVGSAALSAYMSLGNTILAFYFMPSRLWQLASGALMYEVLTWEAGVAWIGRRRAAVFCFELAAVCFLGAAVVCTRSKEGFPFPWALLAVVGTCCFIAAGASPPQSHLNKCFSHYVPAYIGKLSYVIYLWHWPVIVMMGWRLGVRPVDSPLAVAALVMALSIATHHGLEGPFRRWQPKPISRACVVILPTLILASLLLLALRGPLSGSLFDDGVVNAGRRVQSSDASLFKDFRGCANATNCIRIGSAATLTAGGSGLLSDGAPPSPEQCACELGDTTLHAPPCQQAPRGKGSSAAAAAHNRCFVERGVTMKPPAHWEEFDTPQEMLQLLTPDRGAHGGTAPRPVLFLLGDSKAMHLYRALDPRCGVLKDYELKTFYYIWFMGTRFNLKGVFGRVLRKGDIIILSTSAAWYNRRGYVAEKMQEIRELQPLLNARGAWLLLMSDVPRKSALYAGPACVPTRSRTLWPQCVMSKSEVEAEQAGIYRMWSELAELDGVFFFDFYQLYCDATTCNAMIPGTHTLAYMDRIHLTRAGTDYLWPYLCAALSAVLKG